MKNKTESFFYIIIPALFTFPIFKESISSLLLILLILNTIIYTISSKKFKFKTRKVLLFTIPFWILILFTHIDFSNPKTLIPINNGLFFLLFPITFSYIPKIHFSKEKIIFYLEIVKNTCFIIAISYIVGFLYKYNFSDFFVFKYEIPKFRDFVYNEVSFFKIHPTYFTAIVVLSTAFSFEKILKQKKYLELIYLAVFVIITFMLLVKINIIMIILLLFYMMLFRSPYTTKQKISASFFLILTVIIFSFSIPGVKNRFKEIIDSYNTAPNGLAYDSTNIRVSIYKCCYNLAQDHYLFGVGFENLGEELKTCFKNNYGSDFYKNETYLSHNYYLYIFLSSGVFGLILYLFYVFKIIVSIIRQDVFILSLGMINIFILCFTEDFFYRHYGLFYFSLLFFTYYNSESNTN
ncbi:O-antigen ligase family protein [Flavobacterium sp.]|uniref:O-antigen ligase family protein n=1 Tax=Flavobacterium sp. TaxID=239 RepID=UPI00286CFC4C|nr:O-antigen ligase family protein [Flavobacterium sp.]